MKWNGWNRSNRVSELRGSRVTHTLLGAIAFIGVLVLLRELPAMRRYLRMERM